MKEKTKIKVNDAIDLLTITTKELLPESEIPYYRTSDPQILEGFIGIRSLCQFDIKEIEQNKGFEQFLTLLNTRLKASYYDIIDFATEVIESLGDKTNTCKWHKDGHKWEDHDYWETSCGEFFQFINNGPEDNHFKFCPYCGKPIKEIDDE